MVSDSIRNEYNPQPDQGSYLGSYKIISFPHPRPYTTQKIDPSDILPLPLP